MKRSSGPPHYAFSTPRRIWSARRFEQRAEIALAEPSLPRRWMISKNIGPITVWVKNLKQQAAPVVGARRSDAVARQPFQAPRHGPAAARRLLIVGVGHRRNGTPMSRKRLDG